MLGGEKGVNSKALADHAFACGLAAWFRAVPALELFSRQPLPEREPAALRDLAQTALQKAVESRRILKQSDKAVFPALRSGWTARAVLRKAVANPDLVLNGGLEPTQAAARLSLMWKTAVGSF